MPFRADIGEALQELEAAGLLRRPMQVSGPQGPEILIGGKPVLCLCSNNYLGLAEHPAIGSALQESLEREGVGAGASRLITGTMDAHRDAERAFAQYLGTADAVLFSSGYAANIGTVQALVGPGDAIFSDALNHASLIDGCRLSRADIHVYAHRDTEHLRALLREHRGRANRALVITDSLFSMDGDLAPLAEISGLAQIHEAGLMVDEAHALGVFGPQGRGCSAALGLRPDVIVGTLGKSFGVAGAFIATDDATAALIRNRARSFVYSTAPPPMLARAAVASLGLVENADEARASLLANAERMRSGLRALGYDVPAGSSQILPVLIGPNDRTMALSAKLLDRGVFVQGIRPPTVPAGTSRLRLTAMATHQPEQIDRALGAFESLRNIA